jgi:hypothetical protein
MFDKEEYWQKRNAAAEERAVTAVKPETDGKHEHDWTRRIFFNAPYYWCPARSCGVMMLVTSAELPLPPEEIAKQRGL